MKLLELERTSEESPTQYEGRLTDGRQVYIRYRWGTITIRVSDYKSKDNHDAVVGRVVFKRFIGDAYDGHIEHDPVMFWLAKASINTELVT